MWTIALYLHPLLDLLDLLAFLAKKVAHLICVTTASSEDIGSETFLFVRMVNSHPQHCPQKGAHSACSCPLLDYHFPWSHLTNSVNYCWAALAYDALLWLWVFNLNILYSLASYCTLLSHKSIVPCIFGFGAFCHMISNAPLLTHTYSSSSLLPMIHLYCWWLSSTCHQNSDLDLWFALHIICNFSFQFIR